MYYQFLIEDESTAILIEHVMRKLEKKYPDTAIMWNKKSFKGIGHLPKKGTPLEQKTGKLLNDLPMFLRAFDKILQSMDHAALFVVLDNDKRDTETFKKQLEEVAQNNMVLADHVFCIAVKEMEAWLLGDMSAIEAAYPNSKKTIACRYEQDGICDTWEVLADMVYPGGLKKLKKLAGFSYYEMGKAKAEWADAIGASLDIENNQSPSFQYFINQLRVRIEAA
jgi:hypothetical protein